MNEEKFYSIVLLISNMASIFLTPLLFMWLCNSSIVPIFGTVFAITLPKISYWISFLLINVIGAVEYLLGIGFTTKKEESVKDSASTLVSKLFVQAIAVAIAVLLTIVII